MGWWGRNSDFWCRSLMHRAARKALQDNEARLTPALRSRGFSKANRLAARHNDDNSRDRPYGMSELDWLRIQHLRQLKKKLHDDPYKVLFGASEEMLAGKGRASWDWLSNSFPKWMLEEFFVKDEKPEKGDEGVKSSGDKKARPEANGKRVEIQPEHAPAPRKAATTRDTNTQRPIYSTGVVSPSDPRRPRDSVSYSDPTSISDSTSTDNASKDVSSDPTSSFAGLSSSDNNATSVFYKDEETGHWNTKELHDKPWTEAVRRSETDKPSVSHQEKNINQLGYEPEEESTSVFYRDASGKWTREYLDSEPASNVDEKFQSTAASKYAGNGIGDDWLIQPPRMSPWSPVVKRRGSSLSEPPAEGTSTKEPYANKLFKDEPSMEDLGEPRSRTAGNSLILENAQNILNPSPSDELKPSTTSRLAADVLSSLPKDDIDFLRPSDVRASMGIRSGKKETKEEKAEKRKSLETSYKETEEQGIDPLVETQVLNERYIRKLEKDFAKADNLETSLDRHSSSRRKEVDGLGKVKEDRLETALDRFRGLTRKSARVVDHEEKTSGMEKSKKAVDWNWKEALTRTRPFGMWKDERRGTEDSADVYPSSMGAAFSERPFGFSSRIKFESDDTSRNDVGKREQQSVERRKETEIDGTIKELEMEKKRANLEPETSEKLKKVQERLANLHRSRQTLSTNVEETATRRGWEGMEGVKARAARLEEELFPEIARKRSLEEDGEKAEPTVRMASDAATRPIDKRIELLDRETESQKLAMSGLSDDGYARDPKPKPARKLSFDEPSPLRNSLFRPFQQQLDSLGKEESMPVAKVKKFQRETQELAEKRKKFLQDRQLVHEVRKAYEDEYGSITTEHRQVATSIEDDMKVPKGKMREGGEAVVEGQAMNERDVVKQAVTGIEDPQADKTSTLSPSSQLPQTTTSYDSASFASLLSPAAPASPSMSKDASPQTPILHPEGTASLQTPSSSRLQQQPPPAPRPVPPLSSNEGSILQAEGPPSRQPASSPRPREQSSQAGNPSSVRTTQAASELSSQLTSSSDVEYKAPSISTSTESKPSVYKLLAYDPSTDALTITTTSTPPTSASADDKPINLPTALSNLKFPAKFLPHLPATFEAIASTETLLILREDSSTNAAESSTTVKNEKADIEKRKKNINPVDGTTHPLPEAPGVLYTSPVGFVRYGDIGARDEEVEREGEGAEGGKEDRGERRREKKGGGVAGVVKTGIWAGAACYIAGVVGELMK